MEDRFSMEGVLQPIRDLGWTPGAIIDIGVATGTRGLYGVWPDAPICLIEPSPAALPYMQQIAERFPNVKIYNVGASNRSGTVEGMQHPSRAYAYVGPGKKDWEPTSFPVMTCDEIVADAGLTGPFLYKLDTDSHEKEILEGSSRTLAQTDLCIIEVNVFYGLRGLCPPRDIWRAMDEHGFTFLTLGHYGHSQSGVLRCIDMVFAREDSELFKRAFYKSLKPPRDRPDVLLT